MAPAAAPGLTWPLPPIPIRREGMILDDVLRFRGSSFVDGLRFAGIEVDQDVYKRVMIYSCLECGGLLAEISEFSLGFNVEKFEAEIIDRLRPEVAKHPCFVKRRKELEEKVKQTKRKKLRENREVRMIRIRRKP